MFSRLLIAGLVLLLSQAIFADSVSICHGYGCKKTALVQITDEQKQKMIQNFSEVESAKAEREAIGQTMLEFYLIAGEQTPIYQDKGGNFKDGPNPGKMDCVDHSETDTNLLKYLERLGLLRFHRVLKPYYRAPIFFNLHYASRVEENETKQQWVIDTWFYDFGHPPVIMDATVWRKGWYPEGW